MDHGKMVDDVARKSILRRRAKFVAAALATVGVGAIDALACKPHVCLEPLPVDAEMRTIAADAAELPPPPDAADAADTTVEDVPPTPCLRVHSVPPDASAPPIVCLHK
jgi:hypothetical protein